MSAQTLDVVVRRRELQGEAVVVLELAAAGAAALPAFEAGAHVDLHLGDGLVRQYSLCGDPADAARYRLAVLREPGSRGGSEAVHARLGVGAALTIGTPRNHFPLAPRARHSILLGGGIGITPLLAMAHALHAAGQSFELHYSIRARARSAFLAELAAAPFAPQVHLHASEDGPGHRVDVARLVKAAGTDGLHLYVCGPAGFMDAAVDAAAAAGLGAAQIHREHFHAEVDTRGTGFEVVAAKRGTTVRVEAGQSIVSALKAIGIRIEVSCEEGVCGTCVCTVLEGECDHRDVYLTDDEKADNDQIMACCSRAKSARLVLDL